MAVEVSSTHREAALAQLATVFGVARAFVATSDGLTVASRGLSDAYDDLDCALVAALCGAARRVLAGLQIGTPVETMIQTDSHALYVLTRGDLLLAVIAERGAKAGQVRLEMRRAAAVVLAD